MRRLALVILIFAAAVPLRADDPWNELLAGNRKFVAGRIAYDHLAEAREHTRDHQSPAVTVLSCADSRVPPELVFDRTIGELFVVRVAGNVADTLGLASIEYAIAQGYTKMIVVLGHENCGAVRASLAVDDPPTESLVALTHRIRASFDGIPYNLEPATVRRAVEANTRASAAWLTAQSSVVRRAVAEGRVTIVPAYYEMGTGVVRKLEDR